MIKEIEKGQLLVASVRLIDPNFQRTVVLLCEHDDSSSYGLVLNRRIDVPSDLHDRLPFLTDNLFLGGPVQPEILQVVHPYEQVSGAREVIEGVWVGGNFEELQAGCQAGVLDPQACRFFLGYSGWSAGQLQEEFDGDSWLLVPATPALIFDVSPENIWREAIRARGRSEPLLANYPDDPRWN